MKKLILTTLITVLASCSTSKTIKHNYHEIKDHLINTFVFFFKYIPDNDDNEWESVTSKIKWSLLLD